MHGTRTFVDNVYICAEICTVCVFQEENAVCIFSGKPYSELSNEGAESRSREMRRDQEAVERWSSDTRSPRTVARQLPISRAKYERERERERDQ